MIRVLNAIRNIAAVALLVSFAAPASATSVTIGNTDEGNCYPFSCGATDGLTQYQEQYDKAAFTGPITFNSVQFAQNLAYGPNNGVPYGPIIDSASYDVSFYLSNVTFTGLTDDLSSNLGTFLGSLGTFTLGGPVSNVLNLTGNTITYDPSLGQHLLMNVNIFNVTGTQGPYGTYQNFFNSDSSNEIVSRAWTGTGGSVGNAGSALQTTFAMVTATPEPATWAMMVLGFGIAGAALRRRRALSGPAHLAISKG
ncbi:MAG: PEPxxWA-CTERM sorting domain-containing protein [Novosphingobium sp.]